MNVGQSKKLVVIDFSSKTTQLFYNLLTRKNDDISAYAQTLKAAKKAKSQNQIKKGKDSLLARRQTYFKLAQPLAV